MPNDLSTINASLVVLAVVATVQLLIFASALVWAYRAGHQAAKALNDELRPVIARLHRAAEEVEQAARVISDGREEVRNALSTARAAVASVTPVLAPRTWMAAQIGGALFRWMQSRRRAA